MLCFHVAEVHALALARAALPWKQLCHGAGLALIMALQWRKG